jgi:hypothetical protein
MREVSFGRIEDYETKAESLSLTKSLSYYHLRNPKSQSQSKKGLSYFLQLLISGTWGKSRFRAGVDRSSTYSLRFGLGDTAHRSPFPHCPQSSIIIPLLLSVVV